MKHNAQSEKTDENALILSEGTTIRAYLYWNTNEKGIQYYAVVLQGSGHWLVRPPQEFMPFFSLT